MVEIDKAYYRLEEIEERWGRPRRDLAYLAENGLLAVSVRVYGIVIERGLYETDPDGRSFTIPEDQTPFTGVQDLLAHDVYRIFQEGTTWIRHFGAETARYCAVLRPEDGIRVTCDELVVRRGERDRVEARHGLGGVTRASVPRFAYVPDFSEVVHGDLTYRLGPIQARVVRLLYEAATAGAPWRHGKRVLAEAGSSCRRMADLFKTQSGWRRLIVSDGRGKYRLNIDFF
jgi:hypothetical protein